MEVKITAHHKGHFEFSICISAQSRVLFGFFFHQCGESLGKNGMNMMQRVVKRERNRNSRQGSGIDIYI